MALLHLQSSCFTNKPHPYLLTKPKITIPPLHSKPTTITSNVNDPTDPPDKKSGVGFGPAQIPSPTPTGKVKKKGSSRRERSSIIRRTPVEKPAFLEYKSSGNEEIKGQSLNENAFLLTWLGLGGVIFVEGIALSASGFLPEEWDKFFVKFLYPSFTPTVFLFVAGTVVYGVYKYLQNESLRNLK